MSLILTVIAIIAITLYVKFIQPCHYWKKKGIPHIKPWPIFGNMAENFLGTRSFAHITEDMYKKFPNEKYFGLHHYSKPTIMLRDPELIKQICVKDADAFPDHPQFLPEDGDPFFNKSLLSLKGNAWKKMRATLSPAFTSSKLRTMFALMTECSKQFVEYFEKQNVGNRVNIKDAFTRFTNDVAASLALGVRCDSMKNRDNEIYRLGIKGLGNVSFIKFFGYAISPALMKFFKVTFFDSSLRSFLSKIIHETITTREEKEIFRPDMLHLLMEAKKGRLKNSRLNKTPSNEGFAVLQETYQNDETLTLTDDDITAQAVFFYAGGFDTSSNLMCVLAYELAVNADVQEKLRDEVEETLEKCNGDLTYEALLEMKYLDMVVSETLRLWPVSTFSDRMSVAPYLLQSNTPGGKSVKLDVGTYIWLPLYALHRDPKYFPNPNKFDPERFNSDNKDNITPFTYIPFGLGPRGCIASRFALLEAKVIIFYIISQFEIVPVKETLIPFTLSKRNINLVSEGDLILGFRPRTCFS